MESPKSIETSGTAPRSRLTAWRVLRTLVVVYVAICLLMMGMETTLVYPAPFARKNVSANDYGFEDVTFQSVDKTALHGWFLGHPDPRFGLVYFHGNGEDITNNADLGRWFRDSLSASVLLFDYRGYGRSEGRPHEAGLIADGLAAQRWLANRMEVPTDQLVLVGRSLGGAVAVASAQRQGARALILQNTFAEMTDVAAATYPWLPVRWLMRNRYPAREWIGGYPGPLLQCHGTEDNVIPLSQGQELFDVAPCQPKRFVENVGVGHNGPLPQQYLQSLVEFLEDLDED